MSSCVLDRVLRRPVISAVAAVAVLLLIASPALSFKVHNSGVNDLPPGLPGITVLHHLEQAFPNGASPALVVVQAADTTSTRGHRGDRRAAQRGAAERRRQRAVDIEHERAHTVTTVSFPLAGQRHQPRVTAGPRPAA